MTESGPVRGALWMFKADGKGKKRRIESKSKELSGEKKRRKLDSESTEKKEDTVDGGENDSEIAEGIPFEEDYHDSMDGESYKCYFEKSICQNIPKHSVIVIDNAPYHSKNTENYPTSKWRKQQFVDWLTEKNITFPDKALRAELCTLVKSEREKFPDKVMETVAKEHGHEILRLPPYHCKLNPIELAWAAEKNYVAGENKDMSLDSVEKLFRKKREELPEDFWRKCVEHVKKIEENHWESDRIQDNKVEQLIIKLKPTDSSSGVDKSQPVTPIMNARLRIVWKKRSGNQDLKNVHQMDSNPGPHDHQPNTLTTRLPTAAVESTENLSYLCVHLINVYCS